MYIICIYIYNIYIYIDLHQSRASWRCFFSSGELQPPNQAMCFWLVQHVMVQREPGTDYHNALKLGLVAQSKRISNPKSPKTSK